MLTFGHVNMLVTWFVLSIAFFATAWLLPGMKVKGVGGAIAGAAVASSAG